LVLIVILSFAFLLYTVLLDISGKSMAAQGIGTEKYNLLQSSFQNLLIILPLLIAINYIAVKRNYNFDLSSAGKFSFSSISRSILKKVKKEVQVVAFYPRPLEASGPGNTLALTLIRPEIEIILDQLKSINSNFSVKFINADVETDLLGDFGQVSNGTILIRSLKENATGKNPYAEQRVSVQEQTDLEDMERKIVQAVLTVSSEEKNIYFTTLNGERFGPGFTNVPNEQLNKLVAGLNFVNFKANPLGVEQNWPNAIPNDANAIAVIGPTIPLSKETREILMKYITEKNGKLLITIDPRGTEDFTWLLEKSDVIFKKDALSQFDSRPGIIVTKNFQKHPIEESLEKKSTGVVFPYSGYFEMNPAVTKERLFERKTFLESGQETFKDLNNNGKMDNKESKANLILGITLSIEKKKPSDPKQSALKNEQKPEDAARIVIYSGTSWLTDQYFTYNANPGLAVNSASWLLEKEPIAGIVSKK
ncbi:MAG: Gldg family protein, partial [Leptospira sp.]|nr:Gldg family protein [Leptospira sp.]